MTTVEDIEKQLAELKETYRLLDAQRALFNLLNLIDYKPITPEGTTPRDVILNMTVKEFLEEIAVPNHIKLVHGRDY